MANAFMTRRNAEAPAARSAICQSIGSMSGLRALFDSTRLFTVSRRISVATLRPLLTVAIVSLAACATPQPPAPPPETFLHDELFGPPTVRVSGDEIFVLSDAMQRYLRTEIATQTRILGAQGGLVEAVYNKAQLKLEYDSSFTRNAAEAFEARAGNCLSLVVMTAAFAKVLGLQVRYQSAYLEEAWSRSGDLLLRAGHVNVTLGPKLQDRASPLSRSVTIDFLPEEQLRTLRTREVSEQTIVAMYMNNRAVEALMRGMLDDAYAWTRASLRQSPDFLSAHNTLGIVYARSGHLDHAATAFQHVLRNDPAHTRAIANLADVYTKQGRNDDAAALYSTLARLEPEPPLHYFSQGMVAMQRGDFSSARDLFAREADRSGYSNDVAFWLGIAHYRLGDVEQATRFLNQALGNTSSRGDSDSKSAKLSRLKSRGPQ
jgi:tetratricopeptide (TPR) repeat protein